MKTTCQSCGATLSETSLLCPNCGEPVVHREADPETTATPPSELSRESRPPRRGATLYYAFGLGLVALATVVFILSNPPEVKGPPEGATSQAGLPPGHPSTEGAAGMTDEQKAEMDRARKDLEAKLESAKQALAADPGNVALKRDLANYYYDLGSYADAIPLYRAFLEQNPNDADVRTDMAFCMANLKDVDGAIAELRRAVEASPTHQNAPYTMAMMYVAKRDQDSTVLWLKRVIAIDSTTEQGKNAALIIREMGTAHVSPASGQ